MSQIQPIEQEISPKIQSIGVADVLRFMPTVKRRTVGPFVFVDHMGLSEATQPRALDVPPHPHIGLATVTYLFDGAIFHRDSIGSEQLIEPGAVNWMTSGRGIVHSERTPAELREYPPRNYGLQCWVALPLGGEDVEPSFQHIPAAQLPVIERPGVKVRLIAGTGFERESPVRVASPLVAAALELEESASLVLPADHEERALIVLDGDSELEGNSLGRQKMFVLRPGAAPVLKAQSRSRMFLLGGPPLAERRYLDWNFCSTSRERIEEAKRKYRAGELGALPDEGQNLPLPEDSR